MTRPGVAPRLLRPHRRLDGSSHPRSRGRLNRSVHLRPGRWLAGLAFAVSALLVGGGAFAQAVDPTVQVRYDAQFGHVLTGPSGMTLYYFGRDTAGVSNCSGDCLGNWPALLADEVILSPVSAPGAFSVIDRADGGKQVAYNGRPLYYFAGDAAPGDTNGQGRGNVWWVANLEPAVQVLATADGGLLVGPTGMALYTFDNDSDGVSACMGGCAKNWPPLVGGYAPDDGYGLMAAPGVDGTLGLIAREDGGMQVTLNGAPLYYWLHDSVPGQVTGDGVGGVWHVARP